MPALLGALWALEVGFASGGDSAGRPPVEVGAPAPVAVWEGAPMLTEGGLLEARLAPLHVDPARQHFEARVLRVRFGLPAGEPWRLSLDAGDGALPDGLGGLELVGADGATLIPFPGSEDPDALEALLAPPVGSDGSAELYLWGETPEGPLRIQGVDGLAEPSVLEPAEVEAEGLERALWVAASEPTSPVEQGGALARARSRVAELEARVAELDAELTRVTDLRIERERAFLAFQRDLVGAPEPQSFLAELRASLGLPDPAAEEAEELDEEAARELEELDAAEAAAAEAAAERAATLNTLLRSESVWSLELMEAGRLLADTRTVGESENAEGTDEEPAPPVVGCGPVVFRQLDDRGRLAGGMSAARMRLEGSRSGRSLTLVLEDGFFSNAGVREPFRNGEHRVELLHVDPEPFMRALPELFGAEDLVRRIDDGTWTLDAVRRDLNALLEQDAQGQRYRLTWLGGVLAGELRDVRLEVADEDGRVERLVFADALRIEIGETSVTLALRDGSTLRGQEKAPFLDGRMRIVLPRVDLDAWRTAELPTGPGSVGPASLASTPQQP